MVKKSLFVAVMAIFLAACGESSSTGGNASNALSDIEKNCASKTAECSVLANQYKVGGDINKALDLYGKACSGKDAFACYQTALIYHQSNGHINLPMAYGAYEKACNLGHAEACNILAILQLNAGQEKASFANYEKACESNNSNACFNAAVNFHMEGFTGKELTIEQDRTKYVNLLQKACDLGHAQGCNILSLGFFTGELFIESATSQQTRNAVGALCHRACDINDGNAYTECNRQCDLRVQAFDQAAKAKPAAKK